MCRVLGVEKASVAVAALFAIAMMPPVLRLQAAPAVQHAHLSHVIEGRPSNFGDPIDPWLKHEAVPVFPERAHERDRTQRRPLRLRYVVLRTLDGSSNR